MQGNVLSEPNATPPVYAGIDVCKEWLDVYVQPAGQSFRAANVRGDNQGEVRQAKLASSSRCKSGPGKGQRPPGSECCGVEVTTTA